MAIRYCGDAEVRMVPERSSYAVTVRAPHFRWAGRVPYQARDPRSSEAYDRAAEAVLIALDRKRALPLEREGAKIVVRRTFQAPGPLRS